MADISHAMQMTKGALYHHFEGKETIFLAVVERIEMFGVRRLRGMSSTLATPWNSLRYSWTDRRNSFKRRTTTASY